MVQHIIAIISGAVFVIAVISGIGPQSLNLMSHAIKRNHAYQVALTCFLADSFLILIGCIGLSFDKAHNVILMINLIGIIFIAYYVFMKIKNLFRFRSKLNITSQGLTSKKEAIISALMLTFFNPLVFIDAFIVIGGTSYHYHGIDWLDFVIGAILGDFIWCYSLTYVAYKFSHRLDQPRVWFAIDLFTIIVMLVIFYKTLGFIFK